MIDRTAPARRLALGLALLTLLVGCGDDDHHGPRPTPTPTPTIGQESEPFDLDLALALGRLCLESYQMLIDFQQGTTFTLPPPYTLRQVYLTPERYPGELGALGDTEVPIAFLATSGDAVFVVFRGTKTISEWIADATLTQVPFPEAGSGARTETGFTRVYTSVNAGIIADVNALAASGAFSRLYVAGHSLGAAVATLAAPDLARTTPFTAPVLYNFASPRTGNPTFAAAVDDLPTSWRIANTYDEVPKLPPAITVVFENERPTFLFYEHIDSEYPITFGRPIHSVEDLGNDHAMCNYYGTLCDQGDDPAGCKALVEGLDDCDLS